MNYAYLLPVAFLLYGFEKLLSIDKVSSEMPSFIIKPTTAKHFAINVILFSVLSFLLFMNKDMYASENQYLVFIIGFNGMLLFNICFSSVLSSVVLSRYIPGVVSSVLIILPVSFFLLQDLTLQISPLKIYFYLIAGGIAGFILEAIFNRASFFIDYLISFPISKQKQ